MHAFVDSMGRIVIIIGVQWGDEGKGKLVDAIAEYYDVVVRWAGGTNAGHTIWYNGRKYVFHLIPSGLLHPCTIGVIGNGTVVDLPYLVEEMESLEALGLDVFSRIKISLRAHLVFQYHQKIDAELERLKGKAKIGTTLKGIGPTYMDKISRRGIQVGALLEPDFLLQQIEENCAFYMKRFPGLNLDPKAEFERLMAVRNKILPLLADTSRYLHAAMQSGKKILFEGAQAFHLDVDHGTYPFVTSSSISTGGVCTGTGLPPQAITGVIGIAKAYCTRVGEGPFPSELLGEIGEKLQKIGAEFGATTGRPRRCGWFDAVVVKRSIEVNGINSLNLTKLDVLTGLHEVKVLVTYLGKDGKPLYEIPYTPQAQKEMTAEYITLPGWSEDLSDIRRFEDLPENAQKYVNFLERVIGCPILVIGVGPDRKDLIFR